MKYYKKVSGGIYAFELDGSQDDLITSAFKKLTATELFEHKNPPIVEVVPLSLSMRQARLVLLEYGFLPLVETTINAMSEPEKSAALIEWQYAQTVKRDSALVQLLASSLNMSEKDLDDLFLAGGKY